MSETNPPEEPQEGLPEIAPTEIPEPPEWDWKRAEARKPETRKDGANSMQGAGIAFAIGYSFVGPILGGILIGRLLDGRMGGVFTMIGLLVGTVAAFALLIRLVNKLNEK